jgi:quinol monooxygenase YgiN
MGCRMIIEIAQVDITPGREKDFEAAVAKGRPLLTRAKGMVSMELHRSIEKPSRYRLLAKWETLNNPAAASKTEDFAEWRAMIGPFFAAPPEFEHAEIILTFAEGA